MTVNKAVFELRKHTGKTQQIFSVDLGIAVSTLQNYEKDRKPEPAQLIALAKAAAKAGREDLVKIFNRALHKELRLGPVRIAATMLTMDAFLAVAMEAVYERLRAPADASKLVEAICEVMDKEHVGWFKEDAQKRGLWNPTEKGQAN